MNLLYVPGMTTGIYNAMGKLGTAIVKITGIEQSYLYVVAIPVWASVASIQCLASSGWFGLIPAFLMFRLAYYTVKAFDKNEPELRMWVPFGLFFIRVFAFISLIVSIAVLVTYTGGVNPVLVVFQELIAILTLSLALPHDPTYDRLLYGEQEDE